MLTQNEITALNLSTTKKDFVQIWNELLEVAGKLSERWDPTSTNESDPGIVILKALTGIADKLNYNIDKNILEAFMPTAAQEDSMRKLCDMLGYNMKYYRSAETTVNIKYYNTDPSEKEESAMTYPGQRIPKFTAITNSDKDISYFTINQQPQYISADSPILSNIPCMEGQIVKCESSNDNNIITANQITANNRFYLPEIMVAENGIFIYNVSADGLGNLVDGEGWTKVDNLNVQARDSRVYKFGYDSYESRPYIEFPDDYSKLFDEGIFLYYTRTSGINGNVSSRTLTQLELPSIDSWSDVSVESLSVENVFAATSGANAETIGRAYTNFKKTIGTFETLVTCRDYMNKIYSFIESGKLRGVSNILVTDIRNDLNKAITICSCDDAGIFYKETPRQSPSEMMKPVFSNGQWHLGNETGAVLTGFVLDSRFRYDAAGEVSIRNGYWEIDQDGTTFITTLPIGATEQAISNFDLVFYPFKSYTQIKSIAKDIKSIYDNSFTYDSSMLGTIDQLLEADGTKTMSHNIKSPDAGDILSINNYLRLSATIATNSKVTADEGDIIIGNIKKALANAFNMRELDFGDEIPFDSIVEVIENADTRIKVASLNEPALYTTFSVLEFEEGAPHVVEYAVASDYLDVEAADKSGRFDFDEVVRDSITDEVLSYNSKTFNSKEAREIYNKLAVRNVLAGRVSLFNYDDSFKTDFSEGAYLVTKKADVSEAPEWTPVDQDAKAGEISSVWTEGGITYAMRLDEEGNNTCTGTHQKDSLVTEARSATSSGAGEKVSNYITGIKANCKLFVDADGKAENVVLANGERVRFRAPNLKTIKTYPAYVNYNLDLAKDLLTEASAAVAMPLSDLLLTDDKRQKVLEYFDGTEYKKKFSIAQTVQITSQNEFTFDKTDITIGIDTENVQADTLEYTPEELVSMSGFIKLTNDKSATSGHYTAYIEWLPDGASNTSTDLPELPLTNFTSPFVTNSAVLANLKSDITDYLSSYKESLPNGTLTVRLDFEGVPLEAKSLAAWESFITDCLSNFGNDDFKYQVLDFKPYVEHNTVFWRAFGEGYAIGKYVTQDTRKLLKFSKNSFGLLSDTNHLSSIYLIREVGSDAKANTIENNAEYALGKNEYLYIEYTPSTTTDDGTTKNLEPVTEVWGEGTIIRPKGFEVGIMDSEQFEANGNSSHKEVTFTVNSDGTIANAITKKMYSLGASEQIEIREISEVTISKDDFDALYVYKNFNNCPELENKTGNSQGSRTYTLKDGEVIYYTDKNKAEAAYYTSGTEVTLDGPGIIGKFDKIELSTILEGGLDVIPWQRLQLDSASGTTITFTEFQYITLGAGDTIKRLSLSSSEAVVSDDGTAKLYLSDTWQACVEAEYTLMGDVDNVQTLPVINLPNYKGWEACSLLELEVSPSSSQTLRNTDKLESSLTLTRARTDGGSDEPELIKPEVSYFEPNASLPMAFRTNLACQACGNEINIGDVWSNPDNLKGFQLKLFAEDAPVIVETKPGSVIPYNYSGDLATWPGEPIDAKEYLGLWNQVSLDKIRVADLTEVTSETNGSEVAEQTETKERFDNALRLSINLLPDTYGVFCIYIDQADMKPSDQAEVWIEPIPGTDIADISLMSADNARITCYNTVKNKLQRLYLNPGVNCIRVNKTGRIFIKAQAPTTAKGNMLGTLYFDELRLVRCLPIVFKSDKNTNPVTLHTQGLNLAQINYLDTSDTDNGVIDDKTRAILQKAAAEELYTKLVAVSESVEKAAADKYAKIQEKILPDLTRLVNIETLLGEELDTDKLSSLTALAKKYAEISKALDAERSLQAALDTNVKTDDLNRLATLLEETSATGVRKQRILTELENLSDASRKALETISNEDILADFDEKLGTDWPLADMKGAVINKIEEHYQEQLAVISDSLNSSVNSASRTALIDILNSLKANATSTLRAELREKVAELESIVAGTTDELLEQLVEAAYQEEPDYAYILSLLTQLRSAVDSDSVRTKVAEIASAIENSDDEQLKLLLTPLFHSPLFGDGTKDAGAFNASSLNTASAVLTAIDTAYKAASAQDSETKPGTTRSKVDAVKIEIQNKYNTSINSLFTALRDALSGIFENTKSLTDILASLDKTAFNEEAADSHAKLIIAQLTDITTQRSDYLDKLAKLKLTDWRTSACSEFISEAVLEMWPDNMAKRLEGLLNKAKAVFETALTLSTAKDFFGKQKTALEAVLNTETAVLQTIVKAEAHKRLFDEIELLFGINADMAVINGLASEYGVLNTYSGIAPVDQNNTITSLIGALKATTTIKERQAAQALLKEELAKAIEIHEHILSMLNSIANAKCPNRAEIAKKLAAVNDNDFFEPLRANINALDKAICSDSDAINHTVPDDSDYLNILEKSFAIARSSLADFVHGDSTLLPTVVTDNTDGYTKAIQQLIIGSKEIAVDVAMVESARPAALSAEQLKALASDDGLKLVGEDGSEKVVRLSTDNVKQLVEALAIEVGAWEDSTTRVEDKYITAFKTLALEEQLLSDIRASDVNREFYYNSHIATSMAIEFNKGSAGLNTLMNPQINYDANNINNSFVISKLDIDALDTGIQIARSSRLS